MKHKSISTSMPKQKPVVYIVDDDPSVLRGLKRLMDAYGTFPSRLLSPRSFLLAPAGRFGIIAA